VGSAAAAIAAHGGELTPSPRPDARQHAALSGQGDYLRAASWLTESLAHWPAPEAAELEQAVAPARTALGEASWTTALMAGQALTLELAISEALGESVATSKAKRIGKVSKQRKPQGA
jgi:hypothetical protein